MGHECHNNHIYKEELEESTHILWYEGDFLRTIQKKYLYTEFNISAEITQIIWHIVAQTIYLLRNEDYIFILLYIKQHNYSETL